MSYRFLDHTADVAVALEAATFPALLAEAAAAFTDTVTPLAGVQPHREHQVLLEAGDPETLLVDLLGELLYLYEVDGFLTREAEIAVDGGPVLRLAARLRGETYDPDRHPVKVLVKAITYHGLHVVHEDDLWRARVVFDI